MSSLPAKAQVIAPHLGALFSAGTLLLACVHAIWPKTFDEMSLLLIALAALPWMAPYLSKNFRSIQAFGAKLEFVEKKLNDQSRMIDDLYKLAIGENVFNHLRKLSDPQGYGSFYVGTALLREIAYLENLGIHTI